MQLSVLSELKFIPQYQIATELQEYQLTHSVEISIPCMK